MRPPLPQLTNVAALGATAAPPGPPAWVIALTTPHGDLPTIALDFQNGRYWANGVVVANPNTIVTNNASWGTWDSTTIAPGFGLPDTPGPAGWITLPPALHDVGLTALVQHVANTPPLNDPTNQVDTKWDFFYSSDPFVGGTLYVQLDMEIFEENPGEIDSDNILSGSNSGETVETVVALPSARATTAWTFRYGSPVMVMSNQATSNVSPANPATDPGAGPYVAFPFSGRSEFSQAGYLALLAIWPVQPDADLPTIAGLT